MHIRRDDKVVAITGKHAGSGKTGRVLQILPERQKAIVEGFNLVNKSMRKTQENPQGCIGEKEAPMAASNLLPYCPTCKKGTRTNKGQAKDGGKRIRKCRSCGHAFDN